MPVKHEGPRARVQHDSTTEAIATALPLPVFLGSLYRRAGRADEEVLLLTQRYHLGTRGLTGVSLAPHEVRAIRG